MNCENVFRIILLIALLMGVISCQETQQKPATLVAPEESVVTPATAPESEPVVSEVPQVAPAAEHPSEEQAGQAGPEEEVLVSYGEKKLTRRNIEHLQPCLLYTSPSPRD